MGIPQLAAFDHLVLTVGDIPKSLLFYSEVLGMRAETFAAADGTQRHALLFGAQKINLHQAGSEFAPHARTPLPGSADLCFLTRTSLTDWQAHLAGHHIEIEQGPIRRTGATGPIMSIYLRDPDGNLLEISEPIT